MQCESILVHRLVMMIKTVLPMYHRTAPETIMQLLDKEWQAACDKLGWLSPVNTATLGGDSVLRVDGCSGLIPVSFCILPAFCLPVFFLRRQLVEFIIFYPQN
jgi:hypothetical protein